MRTQRVKSISTIPVIAAAMIGITPRPAAAITPARIATATGARWRPSRGASTALTGTNA